MLSPRSGSDKQLMSKTK